MDLLVFAAGVFLCTRRHFFLGTLLIVMGALYFCLAYLAGAVNA
jgi:hypothetical protein